MAVVTASNLRKELAGSLLFEGVSFSVERRDRLALSGPNGAGKTTLLRMLMGESERHGGELAFAKGTRIALHDQRPPLQHGLSLREYALSGARDLVETEEELRSLEQAMAAGDHGPGTLRRYADAQSRLEHAGGYTWRERAAQTLRGLGFAEPDLDRPLETFSGGELTRASLARPSSSSRTTAGSWRRSRRACSSSRPAAPSSSRAPGTPGESRGRRGRRRPPRRRSESAWTSRA